MLHLYYTVLFAVVAACVFARVAEQVRMFSTTRPPSEQAAPVTVSFHCVRVTDIPVLT
jgi:hypothetical protein